MVNISNKGGMGMKKILVLIAVLSLSVLTMAAVEIFQ